MKLHLITSAAILLAGTSCDSVPQPGTDYMLTPDEVERDVVASKNGDSEATKRLAFHYGLIANRMPLADFYFQKCVALRNIDCLAEQADRYYFKATEESKNPKKKEFYLTQALRFNHLALISVDENNFDMISNLQRQGQSFVLQFDQFEFKRGDDYNITYSADQSSDNE
jgi:hypothetical protein